ncbi:hypothetical protein C0T31_11430 [Dysgonamonadaceae bacterium]|nr:hypothetical protein C0T31_11430 [Dysgonamonadaceae bacterium]
MILNQKYYNALINKYSIQQDCNKIVYLSISMILDNYRSRNVYFNFPKGYNLQEITNLLYQYLSQQIFLNHADLTDYSVGDKLKWTKEKGKNIYRIIKIVGSNYTLIKEKSKIETKMPDITFDNLKRNFIKVKQSTKNNTLLKYNDYFKNINEYGFLPTHFSKKLVLIAGQTIWNNLENKNCIPTTYLPNTRDGDQTELKSIEALEDCIAYITPKYEVCYEEVLKKNIAVDTIVVCNTDLNSIPQIIQDQARYNFRLIVLSNESEVKKKGNITLWNWQKEEVELLEQKNSNKIEIDCIEDKEMDCLIQHFEKCIKYVSELEYPIKLKSYAYYLRSGLNYMQEEQFDYLLMLLKSNKELERNEGGYEDFGDNNPKGALKNLISHLKENNPKLKKLNEIISNTTKKTLFVVGRNDIEFFKTNRNKNCQFITQKELKTFIKNNNTHKKNIIFNSFNGSKDFDFIYNLPNDIQLVLYKQEKELYNKQLQIHTNQLEPELESEDRYKICSVKYEPIEEDEVKVSPTLEQIIERLDQRSNIAYDEYKNESDSLLDDLDEEITYRIILSNNSVVELGSNETVFDEKDNLIRSCRLIIGSKIRIYPKEQLAENLFQIAVEVEPEKFGKIDEHATIWQNALKDLEQRTIDREQLYNKLKENGLRVLPATIDAYFRGQRKFPMFNTDLRAILKVAGKELLYEQIKKSKRLYNSTMIALGRGIKQELQQFLKDKTVGEILQKKSFTEETLQKFIDEYMPLLTVIKKEEISDEQ